MVLLFSVIQAHGALAILYLSLEQREQIEELVCMRTAVAKVAKNVGLGVASEH